MNARRWVATLAGASLVATVSVVAAGSTVTVANATITPTAAGKIVMTTTYGTPGTGDFQYYPTANSATSTAKQTFGLAKGTKCQLSYTLPASIISVASDPAGANGYPGFNYGGLGVASSNKRTGQACSQVAAAASNQPAEALFLTFDGTGAVGTYGPSVAYGGVLDVELKGDVVLEATTYRKGALVGTFYTTAGGGTLPSNADPTAPVQACNSGSDSGPDSLSGDNCPWAIGASSLPTSIDSTSFFDMIKIRPIMGTFSLEGGSDWLSSPTPNVTTVFNMASVPSAEVNCGDQGTVAATPTQWGYRYWRLDNGVEACEPVGVGFVTTDNSFAVYKSLTAQPTAQWRIEITKYVSAATNPVPALKIDWQDGTAAANLKAIKYCDDTYYGGTTVGYTRGSTQVFPAGDGLFPKIAYSTMASTATDQSTSKTGFQLSCLYQGSSELQDGGTTTTVDNIYLTGDWKASY